VDADGHCFWDVCVAETVVVVTAIAATAAYLSTPSGQKAAGQLIDKVTGAGAKVCKLLEKGAQERQIVLPA